MMDKFRDPVSGLTHLAAAVLALFGLVGMVWVGWGNTTRVLSLLVYGIGLVLMFSSSAAYHLVKAGPDVIQWLRKLDHSAIYILIAATYTPICLYFFSGFWRWGLLSIIWAMAIAGVVVKLFIIRAPRWLTAGVYLVMGWLSVMAVGEIIAKMPPAALIWLVLGGLFFTIGAIIYIRKWPDFYPGVFGFHEIWHIFVILGALSHFIVIAAFVARG